MLVLKRPFQTNKILTWANCFFYGGLTLMFATPVFGRGLHSSTSQLSLSRDCHNKTPYAPYTP